MSKPKKGKRFVYPLESLLKVRKIREKQQQEAFNKAELELHKERLTETQMKQEQDAHIVKVHEMLSSSELPSLTTIQMNQEHMKALEQKVNEQKKVVKKAEEKRTKEHELLIEKAKEKKIIERDREKTRDAWKKMMDKIDAQFLDELASIKFTSNMIKEKDNDQRLSD